MSTAAPISDNIVKMYRSKNKPDAADGRNREEFQAMTRHSEEDNGHNTRKYIREYTGLTGIHGLYYLTEKRSRCEKIFWTVIVLGAIAGCVYMIQEVCVKFIQSPVIVSFATTETPIYQIPFPAVTICPEAKTSAAAFNYTEMLKIILKNGTMTPEENKTFSYVSLLCDLGDVDEEEQEWEIYGNEFYQIIDEVKPDKETLFDFFDNDNWKCKWLGESYNCSDILVPLITDEGVCYTFNMADRSDIFKENVCDPYPSRLLLKALALAPNVYRFQYKNYLQVEQSSKDWTSDLGYAERAGVHTYPRRALLSGADNALTITLTMMEKDVDFSCKRAMQGFKVLLHHPMDLPRLRKHYFRVPVNHAVVATVRPGLTATSEQVKTFASDKRQCYFQSEVELKYFKVYTQTNCQLECLTDHTLMLCDCVGFFMPRTNDTPICGMERTSCMKKAENALNILELEKKLDASLADKDSCDCKPLCTTLSYDAETSQTEWRVYDNLIHLSASEAEKEAIRDMGGLDVSILSIYFKEDQFLSSERNELYGISDLISNFGGLVGLFTGFSMISLVEVIYFLSLRLFCNERMYGRWSGPPE